MPTQFRASNCRKNGSARIIFFWPSRLSWPFFSDCSPQICIQAFIRTELPVWLFPFKLLLAFGRNAKWPSAFFKKRRPKFSRATPSVRHFQIACLKKGQKHRSPLAKCNTNYDEKRPNWQYCLSHKTQPYSWIFWKCGRLRRLRGPRRG